MLIFSQLTIRKSTYTISIFFFNDTATTEIYTLSLHDALPISGIGLPSAHRSRRISAQSPRPAPASSPARLTPGPREAGQFFGCRAVVSIQLPPTQTDARNQAIDLEYAPASARQNGRLCAATTAEGPRSRAAQIGGYMLAQLLFQPDPSTPGRPSRVAYLFIIAWPRDARSCRIWFTAFGSRCR